MQHEKSLTTFAPLSENLKPKHAELFYVDLQSTSLTNAQQKRGACMHCNRSIASTGATKFLMHLLSCPLCPAEVKKGFMVLRNESEGKTAAKREAVVLAQEEAELEAEAHANEQKVLKQQKITTGLKTAQVAATDKSIAEFFYGNGIAFNAAGDNELYRNMVRNIQKAPAGYVPPNNNKLAGPLLDECYDTMWRKLQARDPGDFLKEKYGSTYVSDGWDSIDHLPLINSAFISNNDGGMYWRSVDTSGKFKTAEYCALLMIQDIYEYGPHNVVLIITDTCATMAKAWALVEDEFPWISVLCCQPHVVSLLMKDIAKDKEVMETINEEGTVVAWFANHQFPLAKLREMTVQKLGKKKELVKAATTRFGTHTLVGERLQELKPALQATVVDSSYVSKNYKDAASTEEATGSGKTVRTNKGATTKRHVLDDDGFWSRVETHVKTTRPLYKMLRRFDTSAPAVGKVYSSWFEAGEHLKTTTGPYMKKCVEAHGERWAYGHSDFAAAAYMLDPEFHGHDISSNAEVADGFMNVVEKIGILKSVRADVPKYLELWKTRRAALGDDPSKLTSYGCYPTYPTAKAKEVATFCQKVNSQVSLYRGKKGTFSREWVMEAARAQPAYLWWDANGASCAELQYVARLVLSQPASASIIERINSEFAFIKDRRRNRLEHGRADKLVALFHNLRLMARVKQPNYSEPAVGWNDEDDRSGVIKYGVANYEGTANLTVKAPNARPSLIPPPEPQQEEMLM